MASGGDPNLCFHSGRRERRDDGVDRLAILERQHQQDPLEQLREEIASEAGDLRRDLAECDQFPAPKRRVALELEAATVHAVAVDVQEPQADRVQFRLLEQQFPVKPSESRQ